MMKAHKDIRMITAMMIRFSLSLIWTFGLLWYFVLVAITRCVYSLLRSLNGNRVRKVTLRITSNIAVLIAR